MADETACPALPRTMLIHGDCLEVMPTLAANSVHMVFADLPYATAHRKTTDCAWDVALGPQAWWPCVWRLAQGASPVVMTATQPFASMLVMSQPRSFRYDIVWDRAAPAGFLNANRCPLRRHEHILTFSQKAPRYYPQKVQGKPYKAAVNKKVKQGEAFYKRQTRGTVLAFNDNHGDRYPTSVLKIMRSHRNRLHPTQKPVALLDWLIRTYTKPGDTVLDPVAGSGTTAIAALRTGRHAICIEKDAGYFDVARKRVDAERAAMGLPPSDCR